MDTLILTEEDVRKVLTMRETIKAVEKAFELHGKREVQMPPKVYLNFDDGDLRAMPAYLSGHAGIKWVNSHPNNPRVGLPTVMAVFIYNDPKTGFPLAIMDGTYLTNMRTGAASAVAAKYLARRNSSVLGFIGCGTQAYTQLLALNEVFDVEVVLANDLREKKALNFAEYCNKLGIDAKVLGANKVCECDILTTSTPSRKPVVRSEWIREGMHINAIGADAPGKQELDENILKRSKIVVDDIEQAIHGGEVNVAIAKGKLEVKDIYATLGEIVAGFKPGRVKDDEITIFDSTGLAIQDVAAASIVFKRAKEAGIGKYISLFKVKK